MPTSLLFVETWSFTVSLLNIWLDNCLQETLIWTNDWLIFMEDMFTTLFWGMLTSFILGMSTSFCFGMLTSLLFVETWYVTVSILNN